jgi:hypothetical protein
MFREVESACERGCLGKSGVSKVLCIRQCVSPSCYRDLYQADQVLTTKTLHQTFMLYFS